MKDGLAGLARSSQQAATRCTGTQEPVHLAQLEATVEKSLQRRLGGEATTTSAEPSVPPLPDQPTANNLQAFERGELLLSGAVGTKRWTDDQVAPFRDLLAQVTGEQASELMRRFSVAVNSGQLAVQTAGAPF